MKISPVIAAAAIAIAAPAAALAQSDNVAAAQALFDEGMKLMGEGKYEEACPKLAESQRLDSGVGTLFNLARCYEKTNRLASAWAKYLEASQLASNRNDTRRAKAARRVAKKLEPKLYRMVILVPNDSEIDGLEIERGGAAVGAGAWGTKVPVDEGDVVVAATAPGHERWETTLSIGGKKKLVIIEIPRLEKSPEKPEDPVFDVEKVPGEPWYRDKVGWTLVATGVVLAGGGAFAVIRAGSLEDDAALEPDLGERDRLLDQADTTKTVGVALFAAAGGLAIAGAIRLALAPEPTERRVRRAAVLISPRSVGVSVTF